MLHHREAGDQVGAFWQDLLREPCVQASTYVAFPSALQGEAGRSLPDPCTASCFRALRRGPG